MANLLFAMALGIAVFSFRFFSGLGASAVGYAEDFACFLVVFGIVLLLLQIKKIGPWLAAAFVLAVSVSIAGNVAHYIFFKTYVNLSTVFIADQLVAAKESVFTLIDIKMLIVVIVLPALIAWLALRFVRSVNRRVGIERGLSVFFIGIFLAVATSYLSADVFVPQQANPLVHPIRQLLGNKMRSFLENPASIKQAILEEAPTLYNSTKDRRFQYTNDAAFPLRKDLSANIKNLAAPANPPNVVIVLMESVRGLETGLSLPLGANSKWPLVAPNLLGLASLGLHFPNFYSVSTQTVNGELATLCSVLPNFTGPQVYGSSPNLQVKCLPQVLGDHGYETYWISAYSAKYANKRGFLSKHGIKHILDGDAMPKKFRTRPKVGWGPSDLDSFDYALDAFDRAKEPFFGEFMTLSNHHPFKHDYGIAPPNADMVSANDHYKNYLHGIHFTDHAIGYFLEQAKSRPWFDNTYFVFLADHSIWLFPDAPKVHPLQEIDVYFKSGLAVYAPKLIKQPKEYSLVGSQLDIAPTILDLVGINDGQAFAGVSLLADIPDQDRFAVMQNENSWSIRQGDKYCSASTMFCFENMFPKCGEKGREKGKSIASGFTCFNGPNNLQTSAMGSEDLTDLSLDDQIALTKRGSKIVKYNKLLIEQNAFFPRK